jgi:hypothetical protein
MAVAFGDESSFRRSGAPEGMLANAVVTVVTELAATPSESLTRRLVALLDLLQLERTNVPFDAQTRFYNAFLADSARLARPELVAIAARLGFAPPDLVNA